MNDIILKVNHEKYGRYFDLNGPANNRHFMTNVHKKMFFLNVDFRPKNQADYVRHAKCVIEEIVHTNGTLLSVPQNSKTILG